MKSFRSLFLSALLLAGLATAAAAAAPATTAFINVSVIPMDAERILSGQTVIVQGDRITAIGPSDQINVPAGAQRIDGRGKYLLPGFGEMHGHNPALGSSQDYVETIYFLFLANGVTTVRSMLGWPGQLDLRRKVQQGEILGPTLYLAGPAFSGNAVPTPAQAEARVREQKAEGWDLLKVLPGLTRETYDALARTAKSEKMRFAGHVPNDVGLAHAIAQGQETIDHLDGYINYLQADQAPVDGAKLAEVTKFTRGAGAWVVPTMVLWETIIGSADFQQMMAFPELKYMPRAEVERWRESYERRITSPQFNRARVQQIAANRVAVLKALHEGGVKILFGTDAPQIFSVPGFSIHREMVAMANAGMSPYAILRSATRNVGEYFKEQDTFGLVAPGQRADLILLNANPLTDVRHVAQRTGVMVRGRWLPETEIQARLEKIAQASQQ